MTTLTRTAALVPLAKLPRAPASDLKKRGWRGMVSTLRSTGAVLVTNHDEPEAVIVSVAEYDALMQIVERSQIQTESALVELRRSFDRRLSVLQGESAANSLQSVIRGPAELAGKVKAGSSY